MYHFSPLGSNTLSAHGPLDPDSQMPDGAPPRRDSLQTSHPYYFPREATMCNTVQASDMVPHGHLP